MMGISSINIQLGDRAKINLTFVQLSRSILLDTGQLAEMKIGEANLKELTQHSWSSAERSV
jgi:hypothetical protein